MTGKKIRACGMVTGLLALLVLLPVSSMAQSTYTWTQTSKDDFDKGTKSNVTALSTGDVALARNATTTDTVGTATGTFYQPSGAISVPGPDGVNFVPGKVGMGLQISGGYAIANDLPVNTSDGAHNTVEFWMNWDGGQDVSPISEDGVSLSFRGGCFGFQGTAGSNIIGVPSTGLENRWIHVAAIYNNGVYSPQTLSLYLDGVKQNLQFCGSPATYSASVSSVFLFGSVVFSQYGTRFNGFLDEIAVYNRALTDQEVALHAASTVHYPATDGQVAYWQLEDGQYHNSGVFTSPVFFDDNSQWKKISWTQGVPLGTNIVIQTRTGNSSDPNVGSWSAWSEEYTDPSGSIITSPSGNFIQWRARLTATSDNQMTPVLQEVKVEYDSLSPIDQISQTSVDEKHPVFSPDGTKLVYNQGNDIYMRNVDGSDQAVLIQTNALHPSFSYDGKEIAFQDASTECLKTKNLDAGQVSPVNYQESFAPYAIIPACVGAGASPVLSPDSQWIGGTEQGYLFMLNRKAMKLYKFTSIEFSGMADVAWSPDQRYITYAKDGNIFVREITLSLDGSLKLGNTYTVFLGSNAAHPWFLPDSKHIVFSSNRLDGFGTFDYEIYLKNIDSNNDGLPDDKGGLEQVTTTSDAIGDITAAAGDSGLKIAYASTKDGGDYDIFIKNYVPGSSPIITPSSDVGEVLFEDTFTEPDGPAGNWTPVSGEWNVQSGKYRLHDTHSSSLLSTSFASEKTFSNFIYQVSVSDGNNDLHNLLEYTSGLLFRMQDESHMYRLLVSWNSIRLIKEPGGVVLTSKLFPRLIGSDFKIIAYGPLIKVYVTGELELEAVDNEYTSGKVGLLSSFNYTGFSPGMDFDNVKVSSIALPPVEELPLAYMTTPTNYQQVTGDVPIKGVAAARFPGTFASWTLEVGEGNQPTSFTTLKESTEEVPQESLLYTWPTQDITPGTYVLRLRVKDTQDKEKSVTSLINVVRSPAEAITSNVTVDETHPVFSPDGTKLAYNQGSDIYIKNTDGTGQAALVQSNAYHPSFSPDGKEIVFQDLSDNFIKSKNLDTGQVKSLIGPFSGKVSPVLSPSGKKIAYASIGSLLISGGLVASRDYPAIGDISDPAWSPDESYVAYARQGNIYVKVIDNNGDGVADAYGTEYLVYDGGGVTTYAGGKVGDAKHPWFLPDGTRIAFQSTRTDTLGSKENDIWIKALDGDFDGVPDNLGGLENVTLTNQLIQDVTAAWSSSSVVKFAYASNRNGGSLDIFVQDYVPSLQPAIPLDIPAISITSSGPGVTGRFGKFGVALNEVIQAVTTSTEKDVQTTHPVSALGKLLGKSVLFSKLGQKITESPFASFYTTDPAVMLTLETDKPQYKPGETVTISVEAQNLESVAKEDVPLTVLAGDVSLLSQALAFGPNETKKITLTFTPQKTFTLKGTLQTFEITQTVLVAKPKITVVWNAPEETGQAPFETTLLLKNESAVDALLNLLLKGENGVVLLDKPNQVLKAGEARVYRTTVTLTKDTVFTLDLSGDVTQHVQKLVTFEEKVSIIFTPQNVYPEGVISVPYTVTNTGHIDSLFDLNITVAGNTLTRSLYIPAGQTVSDALSLNLSSGDYALNYSAFFGQGSIPLAVRGQNQVTVTSLIFSNLTSQTVSAYVKVKNTSWSSFDGNLTMDAGFFADDVALSLEKGEEKEFLFFLPVPLQAGSYPVTASVLTQGAPVAQRTENLIIPEPTFTVSGFSESVVLTAGGSGEVSVTVKNTGVVEGTAKVVLRALDIHLEEKSIPLQPDEEKTLTYALTVPDDYPTGDYAAVATVQNIETDIPFRIEGMKVAVTTVLNKEAYALGENAVVTFTIENQSQVDSVPAFVRVQFNGFDERQSVTVTKENPATVSFSVPVVEGLDAKLFYGVYQQDGGRSLLLNTLYLPLKGDVVTLTTDKQVYNLGDTVTVTAKAEEAGTLKAQYFGQDTMLTFSDASMQTFSFSVPQVRAGTYTVFYDFTNVENSTVGGSLNFDVAGYQVKVTETLLDKATYKPQDTVKVTLRFDSNAAFSGKIQGFLFDPNGLFTQVFETDKTVVKGLNRFDQSFPLNTPYSGLYRFVYGILVKDPEIFLTSGSEAFEVGGISILSLTTDKEDYLDTENVTAALGTFGNMDGTLVFYIDGQPVRVKQRTFSGIEDLTEDLGAVAPGVHTLKAEITSTALSEKESTFSVKDTQPPTAITDLQAARVNLNHVQLSWTGATDNAGVVRYKVLRMENDPVTDANKLFATILTNALPGNTRIYLDTTAQSGRTYYYAVTSFDAAGNESALSNSPSVIITVDTIAPVISEVTPPDGAFSNTLSPVFSAVVTDNDVGVNPEQVSVKIDDVVVPSVYDVFTQKVTVMLPDLLTEKVHTLMISATDYAGNTVTLQTSFTTDVSQPVASITSPLNGSVVTTASFNVTAKLTDTLSGVDPAVTVFKADGTISPYSYDPQTGALSYSWPAGITDGQHEVRVETKDKAGNAMTARTLFTVKVADTLAPVVSNISPADASFVRTVLLEISATITDEGSGVNPQKVFVKIDDRLVLSSYDAPDKQVVASLPQDQPLREGTYTLKITAMDYAGNTVASQTTFTIDVTSPVIAITHPLDGDFVKTKPFTVVAMLTDNGSGIVPETTVLKADGIEYPYSFDAQTYTLTYPWPSDVTDGQHEVEISVKDHAGNESNQKSIFTLDTGIPQLVNVSDTQNPISVSKIFGISANVVDTNPDTWKLTITDAQNITVQSTLGTGDAISYQWNGTDRTGAGVTDGLYTYAIAAKDRSGNVTDGAQLVEQTLLQDDFDAQSIDSTKWFVANEDPGLAITQTDGMLRIYGQATQFGASPIGNGVLANMMANSSNNFTLSFDVDLSFAIALPGASVSANVVIGHPGLGTTALLQFYYHPGEQYEIRFLGQNTPFPYPYATFTLSYNASDKMLSLFCNGIKKAEQKVPFIDGVFSFLAGGGGPFDVVDVRYDNFIFKQEVLTGSSASGSVIVDGTLPNATLEILGSQYVIPTGALYVAGGTQLTVKGDDTIVNGVSSGIKKTEYAVDQGDSQEYAVPFTLPEGPHTVRYNATDKAGNVNPPLFTNLSVDTTAPATTLSPTPQTFTKTKTFTLSANDPVSNQVSSGVRETKVALDGGVFVNYASGITVSDGYHTIEYFSIDNVGNEEQHHTATFTVDTTKPEVTNISDAPDPFSPGASSGVKDTNTISANINEANLDTWQLKLFDAGNNSVQTFNGSGSFITQLWNGSLSSGGIAPDGLYSYSLLATDRAGNINKQGSGGTTTTTTLLQDDFNDNVLDTAKWNTNALPSDPGLTVTEEEGQLRIFGNPQAQSGGDSITGVLGTGFGDATKKLSVSVYVDVSHSQASPDGQPVASLVFLGSPAADAVLTMNVALQGNAYILMYRTFSGQEGFLGNISAQGTITMQYDPSTSLIHVLFNDEEKGQVPMTLQGAALSILAATGGAGSFVDVRFDNFVFTEEGEGNGGNGVQITDNFDDGQIDTNVWQTQNPQNDPAISITEQQGKLIFSGTASTDSPSMATLKSPIDFTKETTVSVTVDVSESEPKQEGAPTGAFGLLGLGSEMKFFVEALDKGAGAQPTYKLFVFGDASGFVPLGELSSAIGTLTLKTDPATQGVKVFFNGQEMGSFPGAVDTQGNVFVGAGGNPGDTVFVKFDNFSVVQGSGNGTLAGQSDGFITVDNTNPTTALDISGASFTQNNETFISGATHLIVTADDPVVNSVNAGIEKTEYAVDDGSFQNYITPFALPEGVRIVHHKATDNAGNSSEQQMFLKVDTTAPITTLSPIPEAFTNVFDYTLSATDPVSNNVSSGVKETRYIIDGGQEQIATGDVPLHFTGGAHTVEYFSTDNVNNAEQKRTVTFTVDNIPPVVKNVSDAPDPFSPEVSTSVKDTNMISATLEDMSDVTWQIGVFDGSSATVQTFNGSGKTIQQVWDGKNAQGSFVGDGLYSYSISATDKVGNRNKEASPQAVDGTIVVDKTNPVSLLTPSVVLFNNQFASMSTTYTVTADDPIVNSVNSGIEKIEYRIQESEVRIFTQPFTLEEGKQVIQHFATDNAGNTEQEKTFAVDVDGTPPASSLQPSASLFNNVYAPLSTTYSLSATDPIANDVSSGVMKTVYKVDGGAETQYASAISLTEGEHTITYFSKDNVLNTEEEKTFTVKVDNTAPVTQIVPSQPLYANKYAPQSTTYTFTANDPQSFGVASGVSKIEYTLDGGVTNTYTGNPVTLTEGIHTFVFYATDNVGNKEEAKTFVVHVDNTPPVAQISVGTPQCTEDGKVIVSATTQFNITANDAEANAVSSGVKEIIYRIQNTEVRIQNNSGTFTLPANIPDGEVTIEFTASDNVENTSTAQHITVILDTTPPVAQILSPQDKSVINNTIAVMGTVTDSHFTGGSVQGAGGSGGYTIAYGTGQNPGTFTDIATGTTQNTCTAQSASCDPLTTWSTASLTQNTLYTLKLSASDCVGNTSTTQALLRVGDPEFALSFGERGSHDSNEDEFKEPVGITTFTADDNVEHVLTADEQSHQVKVFDGSGQYLALFGDDPQNKLNKPTEVATDTAKNIYVVDSQNDRVVKFDKNYIFQTAFGALNRPYGITLDTQGNLYITDAGNNRVVKLDTNGNILKQWTGIKQIVNNQEQTTAFSSPAGVAVDSQENVYVADSGSNRILKFAQDGTLLRIYDATGITQAPVPNGSTPLSQPMGLTLDSYGNLYVADSENDRVQKFDAWGNRLLNFGTTGTGNNPPDGTFHETADVALDVTTKFVYVTDVKNHRVQKFAVVIDAPIVAKVVSQKNDDKNTIISDPNLLNVLRVFPYPSPTHGKMSFNLEVEGNVTDITLEVYTINGKRVLMEYLPALPAPASKGKGKYKADSPSLDAAIESLPNGVYVYRMQISNGVKIVNKTGKFVVVR